MSDHLKPINMAPPPIRVNRRREGHQGRGGQQGNEEEKREQKRPNLPLKKGKAPTQPEGKKVNEFRKLIDGRH